MKQKQITLVPSLPAGIRLLSSKRSVLACRTEISIEVDDLALYNLTRWDAVLEVIGRIGEELEPQDVPEPETPPGPMRRPSTLSINIDDRECNIQVKFEGDTGEFVMNSSCVQCGLVFTQRIRGFQTKALVISAHRLGYDLAGHFERHRTFKDYMRELQEKGESP